MEKASSRGNPPGEGEDVFCIFKAPVAPMISGETDYAVDAPDELGLLDSTVGQEDETPAQGVEEVSGDFHLDLANANAEETTASILDELEETLEKTAPSQEALAEIEGDVEFDFDPAVEVESKLTVIEPEIPVEVEGDVEFDFEPELEFDLPEPDSNDPDVSGGENDEPGLNIEIGEGKS